MNLCRSYYVPLYHQLLLSDVSPDLSTTSHDDGDDGDGGRKMNSEITLTPNHAGSKLLILAIC